MLSITKTDGSDTYVPGSPVTYQIIVGNSGPSDLLGGRVLDLLPAAATSGTWTATTAGGATVSQPAGGNDIDVTVDIPVGGTVTFSYTVQTRPIGADGTYADLVNTVVATPPEGQGSSTSSTDTDTASPVADLVVAKTRISAPPVAGQAVSYQITVTNNGPSAITSFTGLDTTVPALLTPTYTVSTGTYDTATGIWTAFFGDTFDPLVNTASATPPEGVIDPIPENNTSTVTDSITILPVLSITKTDGKTTYVPGTSTVYTIVATNNGPSFLAGGTITDPLPAQVSSATWTAEYTGAGSTGPAAGSGGLDEIVSLAVGGTATFTFTVQIKPEATGDLVNVATITPPPTTQGTPATTSDTNMQASPQVLLSVTKSDGTDRYTPGTSTTYTIVVTNAGPSFLKGGIVQDLLPSPQGASGSWTATTSGVGSSVTPAAGGNDINATIDLPVNGTATFLYTVNILSTATGQLDNTVTVSPPPGTTGNTATATDSNFGPEPPLSVFGGLVIGSDDGCNGPPFVSLLDPNDGTTLVRFLAYEASFRGSVRVATGDVTGDGVEEILVAPGRNRVGEIRVFTQQGVELPTYRSLPFGAGWRGGVEVTAADFNGDGVKDIVAGMSAGAGLVRGFVVSPNAVDPVANAAAFSFRGFPPRYAGGVMLAAGDFGTFTGGTATSQPDGRDEIVVGSNSGMRAMANVWAVSSAPRIVRTILPFGSRFTGGVTLSVAKYDSDAVQDILIGSGIGGKSVVEVYSGATGGRIATLPAAAFGSFAKPNAAVFTAALDLTGDGPATNVYGVQGRNGGRGTNGVFGLTRSSGVTALLPLSTGNLPPLRIAPLKVRLLG
ncbi:MAG: DUF11 domain-containing protein [Planctomycetia bacterium]|nr:DUF11 domain-containing protein [Planctomycetia bacterium]